MVQKVILDMDPGIDDALAIMLAVRSPELQVEAITTVSGNAPVNITSENALKILDNMSNLEEKPPVAKGFAQPLFERETMTKFIRSNARFFHGDDGLGDANLPEPRQSLSKEHAADIIIKKVLKSKKGELTLVTTGPLSNLAFALLKEPEMVERKPQLVMMGGAFGVTKHGTGNITPVAEFNVFADPEAAKIVLGSQLSITAVGLDVTMDPSARITRKEYERIKSAKTESAEVVARIIRNRMASSKCLVLHDPMTVAAVIDPGLVTRKKYHVEVETRGEYTRGQTLVDRRECLPPQTARLGKAINICTKVRGKKFLDLFMERVVFQT